MFQDVSVLIPFKSDNGPRDAAFQWIKKFYNKAMPEAEICIGEDNSELFNRSKAINNAFKKSTRNIIVVADNDTIFDPVIITQSIALLDRYAWVVPFHDVLNISEENSKKIYESKAKWPLKVKIKDYRRKDFSRWAGKLNVLPRKTFKKVGGFDERFIGWGCEDTAFALSVNMRCGAYHRLNSDVYHLWHPYVGTKGNPNHDANEAILKQYKKAKSKEEMKKLILERGKFV
jgi:predicted glycosyltransferase involved in capsule biosynthesis